MRKSVEGGGKPLGSCIWYDRAAGEAVCIL